MPIVETQSDIDAPLSTVFAYVDDYRTTHEWMFGLTQFEPVGAQDHGLGAVFDGNVKLGVNLKSRVQITGWEQDRLIELTSIKGIKNAWRLTFEALGDGRTRMDAHVTFELPGGPVGKAMGAAVKPLLGLAVQHTTDSLKRHLEA